MYLFLKFLIDCNLQDKRLMLLLLEEESLSMVHFHGYGRYTQDNMTNLAQIQQILKILEDGWGTNTRHVTTHAHTHAV